jgi:hypothetical protein
MNISQLGIVGVMFMTMLGTFLWILRAGVKHFLTQQALLQRHLDSTTVVLTEIRDAIRYAQEDVKNGRVLSVSVVSTAVRDEANRVIDSLKGNSK